MDGKGTNDRRCIRDRAQPRQDQATKDVLRLFRGEATMAETPSPETSSTIAGDNGASSTGSTPVATLGDTSGGPTDGTAPTTTSAGTVIVEDNGVGIFPPDDPSCR